MEEVAGTILVGDSFDPVSGRVVVEDGRIAAVEEADTGSKKPVSVSPSTTRSRRRTA
jgi:predicted amidohydrolase YtcJ